MHKVEWKWVKGHSGDVGNDRADALANLGIDSLN
jgi:ribonuclease HI